jgi:hypothetical protein
MSFRAVREEASLSAVVGGAVTRERLLDAAAREGRDGDPLVRTLIQRYLPSRRDFARAYETRGGLFHLGPARLRTSPRAASLLDSDLLRRYRCVPVEILADLCLLAVEEAHALEAVRAVKEALGRDVLPLAAARSAIDEALALLPSRTLEAERAPPGPEPASARRPRARIAYRFERLAVLGEPLHALRIGEQAP